MLIASQAADAVRFPTVESKDLNERALVLPRDLPGERAVVLVAFEREQQADIDGWTLGLHLSAEAAAGSVPWLELPVIQNPGALARWFISGGMRRGIHDHAVWAHVVTLYLDKAAFKRALGITDERQVQALVVDRTGNVLERVIGDFTHEGAARLRSALAAH